jgi:histidine triad (HIT) family protein
MNNCIFCKIAAGIIPANFLYNDEQLMAFHDLNPQAPVHVLIIPREHIATLNDLTFTHEALIGKMILVARQIADKAGISKRGYRTVFNCNAEAGQSVFHVHLHLLGGRPMNWPPG